MPSAEHEFVYFIWARQAIKTNKIISLNNDHLRYGIGVQRPSYKTTIFYMQIVEMSLLSLSFFSSTFVVHFSSHAFVQA